MLNHLVKDAYIILPEFAFSVNHLVWIYLFSYGMFLFTQTIFCLVRIRNCLSQLYAKHITPDDKQELDEALQREVC